MELNYIRELLPPGSLFGGNLLHEDTVDSTNTRLKLLAEQGAPEGTVLLAEEQTAGRGTQGRSFSSPAGRGLYLSLLLRPRAPLSELLTLTARVAVAVREGIEAACSAPAAIKWLNDIHLNGRKVCGILTELGDGFVVVGIGINVSQTAADFRAEGLEHIAVSLAEEGFSVCREELAAAVLTAVEKMYREFPHGRAEYLARYRAHCTTVGRRVSFSSDGETRTGTAVGIDGDFSLLAEDSCGRRHTVSAGTVTLL